MAEIGQAPQGSMAGGTVKLVLEHVDGPRPGPPGRLTCTFNWQWNYGNNTGTASLLSIEGAEPSPALPLDLQGVMSKKTGGMAYAGGDSESPVELFENAVTLHHVVLVIDGTKATAPPEEAAAATIYGSSDLVVSFATRLYKK